LAKTTTESRLRALETIVVQLQAENRELERLLLDRAPSNGDFSTNLILTDEERWGLSRLMSDDSAVPASLWMR
jgi:hypothetical protein